ncbi:MAG: NAD(P)H-binding protein [Chitinophagaceae bacterium]|nr:NAD(P)H-binding protein [Chitinophagaceae bacterium]
MRGKTAAIIGATGLTGSYLYHLLLDDKSFDTIRVIVRRPVPKENARTEIKLVDFRDAESFRLSLEGCDVVFCAVGTTQKKVNGDKALYRTIDYDIPANAANFCKMNGCEKFVMVSAVGANSKSSKFYLSLKGEAEEEIRKVGLSAVHIMRPSILLGDRKEFRFGEKIGIAVTTGLSFLLPSKYKPIHANEVARAMLAASKLNDTGFFIHEYTQMRKLGNLLTNQPQHN